MAATPVTSPFSASVVRQRQRSLERIKLNLTHWIRYVQQHQADVSALDTEREQILAAILYGFRGRDVWLLVYQLITEFTAYMERRGHWDSWQRILEQAIRTSQHTQNIHEILTLRLLSARLSQHQHCVDDTIKQYRQIIKLARRYNNRYEEARACTNLGYLFIERGLWYRSEILCCYALAIAREIKSDHIQAHTENHLGELYTRQERWAVAEQYLVRACDLWRRNNDLHGLMRGLINLSLLYNFQNLATQSLVVLKEALQCAETIGDETEIGGIYLNMAVAYRLQKNFTEAQQYAFQAKTIFERFNDLPRLALTMTCLGLSYIGQDKLLMGRQYLLGALDLWRHLDNKYRQAQTLSYLMEYELR